MTPTLSVRFFATSQGAEPVREWLREQDVATKKAIGEDIKTVQFGWPIGMPLVRKLDKDVWEVRSHLPNRIARLVFSCSQHEMIVLHGFIKKSQKTQTQDLKLAKTRLRLLYSRRE